MELQGKVALVTGGKRIGAVVATELARAGADLALVYNRSREEAEDTATAVRAMGRRAFTVQADVTDADAVAHAVDQTLKALGRVDVLVNMASLYTKKTFLDFTVEEFDQQLAVDLRASFLFSRAVVPSMKQNGGGRIVNFSDWLAASGRPRYHEYMGYYVAKGGVKALTEVMALDLAADQILVNAVAPGPILAPPGLPEHEHAEVAKNTPVGRWGGEMAIAKAVLFFVGHDFVTGETIRVDGGRHLR